MLVRAAQKGDDFSFAELVRAYQDIAVAYATSILRDYQLAEDVAQEAFVNAYQELKSLREPAAFGAWLRTIVFKHCDRMRRRKQHIITGLEAALEMASSNQSPDKALESREVAKSIWKAVSALSDAEQTVVLLYYMGEYSHSSIAEFLNVTTNTVKTRLYSARRHLRSFMIDGLEETLATKRPSSDELFARRVMSATLSLQLYYLDSNGSKRKTGSTISARAAEVPASRTWLIEPRQTFNNREWESVLRLMTEMKVPGLGAQQQITDSLLERISRLDHLTYLDLSGSPITDAGLRYLSRLPRLEHLNLSCPEITDDGLKVLQDLPLLRTLELYHQRRITDAGIASLTHCDQLEHVNLMGTHPNYLWLNLNSPLTDNGVANLTGLNGLYALNLFGTTGHAPFDDSKSLVTTAGLSNLARLPHLGWLGCNAQLCTDEAMRSISMMPRLRFLMCQDAVAGDEGFSALARSQTIAYIWGRRCYNLTGRGFAALSAMPALRGLSVSCKNVDDDGLLTLPDFSALKEFMPMDVPDAGFLHIGRCEQLEALYCMYCRDTTDAATEHIAGLKKLKTYQAWSTQITNRSLEILGGMRSLEDVGFYGCLGLTNAGMAYLATLPRIRMVDLEGLPNVTQESATVFPARVRLNYSP